MPYQLLAVAPCHVLRWIFPVLWVARSRNLTSKSTTYVPEVTYIFQLDNFGSPIFKLYELTQYLPLNGMLQEGPTVASHQPIYAAANQYSTKLCERPIQENLT